MLDQRLQLDLQSPAGLQFMSIVSFEMDETNREAIKYLEGAAARASALGAHLNLARVSRRGLVSLLTTIRVPELMTNSWAKSN